MLKPGRLLILALALALVLPGTASGARKAPGKRKADPPKPAARSTSSPLAVVSVDEGSGMLAESGIDLALIDGNRIVARALPRREEGWGELGQRLLGRSGLTKILRDANDGKSLKEGVPVLLPWSILKPEWRRRALVSFFPRDSYLPEGVQHVVRFKSDGARGETLAAIAEWYTGKRDPALLKASGRRTALASGDVVTIPRALLVAEIRAVLPPEVAVRAPSTAPKGKEEAPKPSSSKSPMSPMSKKEQKKEEKRAAKEAAKEAASIAEPEFSSEAVPAEPDAPMERAEAAPAAGNWQDIFEDDDHPVATFAFVGPIEYRKDERGMYAAYYLRAGEALYSAVVGRFTGRVDSDEVNDLASQIAVRSGIADVTDIPIGAPVKIPLDLLLPEYLPPGHPERTALEATRRETAKVEGPPFTDELHGVTVILDSGHGGEDVGAMANGAWESDYVFDIMARCKRMLESETAARVVATVRDVESGFTVFEARELSRNKAEAIQTTPPYRPVLGRPGVHFRWYLANYNYRKLVKKGARSEYVVFTSIHADSLHPSMRGAMVYVPGRGYRTSRFSRASGMYGSRKEVKDEPVVSFTAKELITSEGLSRQLAGRIMRSFQALDLPVHANTPIRDHVIRQGRSWVPAVLKYSQVPTSLLLEVCNLNNAEDAKNLRDPRFRERVARAYVNALRAHFGAAREPEAFKAERSAKDRDRGTAVSAPFSGR